MDVRGKALRSLHPALEWQDMPAPVRFRLSCSDGGALEHILFVRHGADG